MPYVDQEGNLYSLAYRTWVPERDREGLPWAEPGDWIVTVAGRQDGLRRCVSDEEFQVTFRLILGDGDSVLEGRLRRANLMAYLDGMLVPMRVQHG